MLTWWQGAAAGGHGTGADYIADTHGKIIETLTPGNGLNSDVHEFRLTPDGRTLITSYRQVPADLTAIGRPKNGAMDDTIASVVDVATHRVLFQWSAAQHVPLTDTTAADPAPGASVYDPYHMNSIALDPRGNLLISMRDTSTVYDVDIHTGAINWQLGGKRSTFALGPGVEFAFQHDAEYAGPDTIRLFNDNSSGQQTLGLSSVQWIHLDSAYHRAALGRNQTHPRQPGRLRDGQRASAPEWQHPRRLGHGTGTSRSSHPRAHWSTTRRYRSARTAPTSRTGLPAPPESRHDHLRRRARATSYPDTYGPGIPAHATSSSEHIRPHPTTPATRGGHRHRPPLQLLDYPNLASRRALGRDTP